MLKTPIPRIFLAISLTSLLLACGGGGGDGGGGSGAGADTEVVVTQNTPFPNPARYVGTWVSNCNSHKLTTLTISNVNGTLQANFADVAYLEANCTGAVLASTVGANFTFAYLETVNAQVLFPSALVTSTIAVDKASARINQFQTVVTGSTVYDYTSSTGPQRCVDYSVTSRVCWDTAVYPASTGVGGLYADGTTLYTLQPSGNGNYTVESQFQRGSP